MSHPPAAHLRGVLSMLIAVAAFCFMDASMKLLAPHYPPMEVAALRGLASLPLVLAWALVDGGPRQLVRVRWSLHLVRGVLSVIMLVAFVYGIQRLPLAEAYSLFFVAPLLITALAGPILGERVGWRRWAAIAVGLCGTIIVLRPTGAGMLSLGGLAIIVSATGYALSRRTLPFGGAVPLVHADGHRAGFPMKAYLMSRPLMVAWVCQPQYWVQKPEVSYTSAEVRTK